MSLWAVLATGLAGGAAFAAVQGGLLAGVVARRHPRHNGVVARLVGGVSEGQVEQLLAEAAGRR